MTVFAFDLNAIQSAAFVVCLDRSRPVTRNDASRACMHGNGANRWYALSDASC